MTIRRFEGYRPKPPEEYVENGISNVGEVPDYEGVIFTDGNVVVRWLTRYRSTAVFQDYDTFYHIHGHPEYGTEIRWL